MCVFKAQRQVVREGGGVSLHSGCGGAEWRSPWERPTCGLSSAPPARSHSLCCTLRCRWDLRIETKSHLTGGTAVSLFKRFQIQPKISMRFQAPSKTLLWYFFNPTYRYIYKYKIITVTLSGEKTGLHLSKDTSRFDSSFIQNLPLGSQSGTTFGN